MELVQEVYITIFQKIKALKSNEALYGWLKTIIFNQGVNMLKKKKREVTLSEENVDFFELLPDENTMVEENYLDEQDINAIKECINKLSDEQRAVIMAYYYDNLKVEEIADLFAVSSGTIKSRLYLARKKLKEYLEEQERKQGYKFHSFGVVTLVLALKSLLQENMATAKNVPSLYEGICKSLGIFSDMIIPVNVAEGIVAETGSRATELTIKTVGKSVLSKAANAGAKKVVITTLGIVTATAVAGTAISVQRTSNKDENQQEVISESVEEADIQVSTSNVTPELTQEDMAQAAMDAYNNLLAKGKTETGFIFNYYTCIDINGDDIPELLVSDEPGLKNDWSSGEVYTYNNKLILCGDISSHYDHFYYVNENYIMGCARYGNKYISVDECIDTVWGRSKECEVRFINQDITYTGDEKFEYYNLIPEEAAELGKECFINTIEPLLLQDVETGEFVEDNTKEYILCNTEDYEFYLPMEWSDHYYIDALSSEHTSVRNMENYKAFGGGWLFSIIKYSSREEFEYLPAYELLQEKNGYYYVAMFPTDVQFDYNSEELTEIYNSMYDQVDEILRTLVVY